MELCVKTDTFFVINSNLQGLCSLLEKGDLSLRLATGEVIALIYELGREIDDTFDGYVDGLYDLLKELATDSSRYKAKREKRQQRSTFRDILRTVEVWSPDFFSFTVSPVRTVLDSTKHIFVTRSPLCRDRKW